MNPLIMLLVILMFTSILAWIQTFKPPKRKWMVCPSCQGRATGEHVCMTCNGKGWIYK